MRLGFDMDEVVVACIDGMSAFVKKEFGLEWGYEDFTCYDFNTMHFTDDVELNKIVANRLKEAVVDPSFMFTLKPYDKATRYIRELKAAGHSIHFISARPSELEESSKRWLDFYGIPFDTICNIGRSSAKGSIGKTLFLDLFVDDEPSHLESMLEYKKQWPLGLLLMDRPYNIYYKGKDFIRIYSWQGLMNHIDRRQGL